MGLLLVIGCTNVTAPESHAPPCSAFLHIIGRQFYIDGQSHGPGTLTCRMTP